MNKTKRAFDKMMGNPIEAVEKLCKEARELKDKYCKCGNIKIEESDFCKECI